MKTALRLESLSDDALLTRLDEVVARGRRVEAELIWHVAEVDRRQLFAREACPSMHEYATSRLHLSDAEAYLRIAVARVSRRFPQVLSMLADGRLHLSAISMLRPYLREENCEALLRRASHRSKREIEILIAEIAPRPDAPSGIRRLPRRRARPAAPSTSVQDSAALVPDEVGIRGAAAEQDLAPPSPPPSSPPPMAPGVVTPTAPERYRVRFTADEELNGKIERARALLRHQIPNGDLAAVFDRAMTLLVRELERVRFAATSRPRKSAAEVDPTRSSRHVPAAIQREVWARDGEQCTFHDRHGRRCPAREWLELHHIEPFARGGEHSAANITLRCFRHNAYQASLDFGADFMAAKRGGDPSTARCPRAIYRVARSQGRAPIRSEVDRGRGRAQRSRGAARVAVPRGQLADDPSDAGLEAPWGVE